MNQTKIVSIESRGTFESSFGTMHKFDYVLADGTAGESNHKTVTSPFKEGQEVVYEINGKSPKGVNKLKLSKPDSKAFGGSSTSGDKQTHSVASNAPKAQGNGNGGSCGPTIGMCVNKAVEICLALKEKPNSATIHKHAWEVMRAVKLLEDGVIPAPATEDVPY